MHVYKMRVETAGTLGLAGQTAFGRVLIALGDPVLEIGREFLQPSDGLLFAKEF